MKKNLYHFQKKKSIQILGSNQRQTIYTKYKTTLRIQKIPIC